MALLHIVENQDASWFGLTTWLHDVGQNWASAHTEHESICLLSSGHRITTRELKQPSRHSTNDLYTCYTLFHYTMCSIGRTDGMNALPHPCVTWRGRSMNEWLQHRTVSQAEVGITVSPSLLLCNSAHHCSHWRGGSVSSLCPLSWPSI